MLLISIKQCKNNNIIFIKKKTFCKVEIESLQNKDYSHLISKKGTNQTKERKSLEIKNSINEFEVSLNENQRIMQNEDFISKKKLDTVREVNSEFSNRKNENKKQLNYNKTNSKKSSCTEKIDSEKRVENYYKKSQQLMKLFPKKKNNNNQNYEMDYIHYNKILHFLLYIFHILFYYY